MHTRSFKLSGAITLVLLPLLGITLAPAAATAAPPAPYHLANTLTVSGEGRWDYVIYDPAANLLYVPRSTHTMALDVAGTGAAKVVADIPDTAGVHGVALVPDLGRGFTSNGKDGTVTVFDLKTHQVLGKVTAADDADCIMYDPFSKRVLAICGDAKAAVPIPADIDPAKGKADAPVDLGGKPEYGVADGKGHVYVNITDRAEIVDLDTTGVKDGKPIVVAHRWPLAPGAHPTGLSMDRATRRLFSGCRNQALVVMNADNGNIVAHFKIGAGVDATAFDAGYVLASCGDGTLTVVHEDGPDSFKVAQVLKTQMGARTMAVDPDTHTIYLPTADFAPAPTEAAGSRARRQAPLPGTFHLVVVKRSAPSGDQP